MIYYIYLSNHIPSIMNLLCRTLLLLIFGVLNVAYAQPSQQELDSIKAKISLSPEDSNKVNLIYTLGRKYDLYSSKHHIEYFMVALNLAKKISYKSGMKKIYLSLINYLFYKEMNDVAMNYCIEYIEFLEKESLMDDKNKAFALLGNLLTKDKKYAEAAKYYHINRAYSLGKKDEIAYASALNNICILHYHAGAYDSALIYSQKAVELFKRNNRLSEMANSILGISEIMLLKNQISIAEQKANEALLIYQTINIRHGVANSLYVLATINKKLGRSDSAAKLYTATLKIADSLHLISLQRDCYKGLSEMYAGLKDYKNAYEFYILHKIHEDSLAFNRQRVQMMAAEVKFDIAKKESLLKEQQYELDKRERHKNILIAVVISVFLLFVMSYTAYSQKKKSNKLISEQKQLVEHKQKEILDSIHYAKRIQSALITNHDFINSYLENFIFFQPKDIVSGDFYAAVTLPTDDIASESSYTNESDRLTTKSWHRQFTWW